MAIPYVVRKKADLSSGKRKELWYGVPRKLQDRGGVQNKELSELVEMRGGFHRGQVAGILVEVADAIRYLLSMGQSVTIDGLGTFQTALTSPGFERPEQVTPGKVSVSRVYFVAGKDLRKRMKETKCMRVPFYVYMPERMLTKEMVEADRVLEEEQEENL